MDEILQQLKESLLDFNEQISSIQARADAEKRDLTEDEDRDIASLFSKFEQTEEQIERRERILAQTDKLSKRLGRQTGHEGPTDDDQENPQARGKEPPGTRKKVADIRAPFEDKGKHGFRSLGEFSRSVHAASAKGSGPIDPRLIANAPTTWSQESIGADGGFAVPPDFRTAIMEKVMGVESLVGRTDQMTTSSNNITFPTDETTPWGTGGVQAYWEGEGDQKRQSKLQLGEETVKLNKLAAIIPVTDELLEDAPSLDSYLRKKVPEKFDWKCQDAIINGTGVGMPLGILNSASLVTVAKDTATSPIQAADTIRYSNILAMWNRLYAPLRKDAVWLINQDAEGQLDVMTFDPTSSVKIPVYLPAGGASSTPYATLKGRPVIPIEAAAALGDVGDIMLVNLKQYMTVSKVGGIRSDVSIHLWFDYDITAFRFVLRLGGQPWWKTAITPANGSSTRGAFIALAAR